MKLKTFDDLLFEKALAESRQSRNKGLFIDEGSFVPIQKKYLEITEEHMLELLKAHKFVKHIESHLKEGEVVLCKVCGESIEEIDSEIESLYMKMEKPFLNQSK